MKLNRLFFTVLACLALLGPLPASAKDIASVNGDDITQAEFEQGLRNAIAQGQKDSPELRNAVLNELINRLLLVQKSKELGLDKTPEAKVALKQAQENLEINLLWAEFQRQNPVSEADVKAEYDRQIAALGPNSSTQYQVSVIAVQSKEVAEDIIARLGKGDSFQRLSQYSIAPSKAQGGALGWIFPNQLPNELATELASLKKGANNTKPIQAQGAWWIVKRSDSRPYKAPTYAESKARIANAIVQQKRNQFLQQLRASAKIKLE